MARVPSLRELRRQRPANVAILPTAPTRQVQQHYGRAYREARGELLDSQALAFPYKLPASRETGQAQTLELRPDVPPFDPGNPKHLRAWEAIWDFSNPSQDSDHE